ncbi:MAG: acyl-CoA dehydrogenase family protein [Myxococcota bacterium]|nr:acyl-CoA dehydrogenase family protein [Myxococcota bacterium]
MDFSWTADQQELYERALTFARALPAPHDPTFPGPKWRQVSEFGLTGLCLPERYGGLGFDALTTARVGEAFGRGCEDTGLTFAAFAHLFACAMPILEHGTEAQRERYLPALATGQRVGANAITEAESGSDVYAMASRAVREGDGYVLSGVKSYVSNGPGADLFLVYAVTRPEHGYFGMSAFAVERETPGLRVGRPFQKMGLAGAPISSLYLEDCRVPESARIGEEGQGAPIFQASMRWERACLFAAYVGMMERLIERSVEYATSRKQFKKPIGRNQAISHRIADMKLRLESSRLLLYRACWQMDRGEDATLAIALSKLAISEAAVQCGLDAIQIHGGMGYLADTGIEQALRDAIPTTLFSGTSEMQRETIARELGL